MGQVSQRLELYIALANELSLNPSMTHNSPNSSCGQMMVHCLADEEDLLTNYP